MQSIMYLITTNKLDSCSINIKNPFVENNKIDLVLAQLYHPSIDVNIVNSTPFIKINLSLECTIESSGQYFDYNNQENIKILKNEIQNFLNIQFKDYLYLISKKYNSDIVGFRRNFINQISN